MAHLFSLIDKLRCFPSILKYTKPLLIIGLVILPSYIYAQSVDDCLMCHSDNTLTMEKKGKEISLFVSEEAFKHSVHSKLTCVSCHKGFDPENIPHAEKIQEVKCVSCHQNVLTKHTFHAQILKSKGLGKTNDTNCIYCHGTHDILSPKNPESKWSSKQLIITCGNCHKSQSQDYLESNHAKVFQSDNKIAPNCLTCHKSPITDYSFGDNKVDKKKAQEQLCLSCHLDNAEVRQRTTHSAGYIKDYEKSVHGYALNVENNGNAASCVDCHRAHMILKGSNSQSSVNRINVPETCGKCHNKIEKEYNASIHGELVLKGNDDAPSCTYCHGEHNILSVKDANSPVAFKNLSKEICAKCHESVRLTEKYGISSDRFETFAQSYHGLALSGGSASVANCSSCHGVHNILPPSDPASTVNKNNLVKTCGKCHPGADQDFIKGQIHVTITEKTEPILYWITGIYIVLIVSIISGMFLHNILDLFKKSRVKKLKQLGRIQEEEHGHSLYLRMTVNERIQHATMALSFIVLVITGFMLRFPNSWWVNHIKDISNQAFWYRSLIHRIAAVIMISVSLYHIYYISFTQRGRQLVKDLFPKFKDFTDAIDIAKYNLGFSKDKPKLDRFSYVEKAEYWALVWGTIVMSLTGLLMWIYVDKSGYFTKLDYDIGRTIHYFEAWLAFLAIVVWHFYFVIFNPDIYPMSLAWLKGTITEEEMAEEHPLELKRLKEQKSKSEE